MEHLFSYFSKTGNTTIVAIIHTIGDLFTVVGYKSDISYGKWYFSIIDVVGTFTNSENPQVYWRVLKKGLSDEGNETVTITRGIVISITRAFSKVTPVHCFELKLDHHHKPGTDEQLVAPLIQ